MTPGLAFAAVTRMIISLRDSMARDSRQCMWVYKLKVYEIYASYLDRLSTTDACRFHEYK